MKTHFFIDQFNIDSIYKQTDLHQTSGQKTVAQQDDHHCEYFAVT